MESRSASFPIEYPCAATSPTIAPSPGAYPADTVFGVKESLVAPFDKVDNGTTIWKSTFDFVLAPHKTR